LDARDDARVNTSFDFSDRTVVVTGGAQGIGAAIAGAFARANANVYAFDLGPTALDGGADDVRVVRCDVSDARSVDDAVASVVDDAGAVDVLINNAGIVRDAVVWKIGDDDWSKVIGVHLTGTFHCTRAVVPSMRASGSGRIVNVTSYSGLHGNFGQSNYAAAKAGIVGFTRTAAKELAAFGITVNAISPNAETAMVASISSEAKAALTAQIPLGRFGDPAEMAPAALFLASDEASYITGVVLPVDGGLAM
jgi:3-oxoacyl-[acyl-carrier protein] reductase